MKYDPRAAIGLAMAFIGSSAAAQWQTLESIERTAEHHVASSAGTADTRTIIAADPLDARLKLPVCADELSADTPYGNPRSVRITVEISCAAPKSWRVYVPVRVEAYGSVVVAARPLPRNAILAPSDLTVEERALGQLARGYVASPEDAVGLKLRRPLAAGAPITPAALASPPLVERGQLVTLQARTGGVAVAMTGTALEAGARGAVIDVENGSSGKRVQAVVRSQRVVEVLLE